MLTGLSLLQFFEENYVPQHDLRPGTVVDYSCQVDKLNAWWRQQHERDFMLADLTKDNLRAYLMYELKDRQNRPSTVNKSRRTLNAVWTYAHDEELVATSPNARMRRPFKEDRPAPVAWTIEEFGRILHQAEQLQGKVRGSCVPRSVFMTALLWTLYNTGLRITALMSIHLDDMDLKAGFVTVRSPSQKQRADQVFDLKPETIAAVRKLLGYQRPSPQRDDGTLFWYWQSDRTQRGWRALTKLLKRVLRSAELPTDRTALFHRIRKTAATQWTRNCPEGILAAQNMLGHSSISVTRRYIDPRQAAHHRASDFLDTPAPPRPERHG